MPENDLQIHSGPLPQFMRTTSHEVSCSLRETLVHCRSPSTSTIDVQEIIKLVESGGTSNSTTLDAYLSSSSRGRFQSESHRRVFTVLALDVAVTQTPGFFSTSNELLGRQTCWALCPKSESLNDNWYRRALTAYFGEKPYTSLLSYPAGRESGLRWWVASPLGKQTARSGNRNQKRPSTVKLRWEDDFQPNPQGSEVQVPNKRIQARFEAFARHVFSELSRSFGVTIGSTSALVWVYVGPPAAPESSSRSSPPWGQSLFFVVRPARLAPNVATRGQSNRSWLTDGRFRAALQLSIERLTLLLGLSGYLQASVAKTIWEDAHQTCAEMVSHEFKNLMRSLTIHVDALHQHCLHDPGVSGELRERLRRLVFEAWWVSAYSGGFYRLSDRETRAQLTFTTDRAVEAVAAAARFSLHLLAESRMAWTVCGPSRTDCVNLLCDIYGLASEDELRDCFAVALLAFLVSEPARNIRVEHEHPQHGDVSVEVTVAKRTVAIRQTTHETRPPRDELASTTIEDLNALLPSEFAEVDPMIHTHSVHLIEKHHYVVSRETRILVHGRPSGDQHNER